jgi:hypothetical protein
MNRILTFLFIIYFYNSSCSQTENNFLETEKDGITIKAKINKDSTFKDTVFYFNANGLLLSKSIYKGGLRNGDSTKFFINRNPESIFKFKDNLLNGYHYFYDSATNKIKYCDYFYNDLSVGPIIFYDEYEQPNKYFFAGFDNSTLLGINYDYWNGIDKNFITSLINYTGKKSLEDTNEVVSIFLYLIQPPKFSIKYSILKNSNYKDEEILKINDSRPFINFNLPFPKSGENYIIQVDLFDSLKNKPVVIKRQISWREY